MLTQRHGECSKAQRDEKNREKSKSRLTLSRRRDDPAPTAPSTLATMPLWFLLRARSLAAQTPRHTRGQTLLLAGRPRGPALLVGEGDDVDENNGRGSALRPGLTSGRRLRLFGLEPVAWPGPGWKLD